MLHTSADGLCIPRMDSRGTEFAIHPR